MNLGNNQYEVYQYIIKREALLNLYKEQNEDGFLTSENARTLSRLLRARFNFGCGKADFERFHVYNMKLYEAVMNYLFEREAQRRQEALASMYG